MSKKIKKMIIGSIILSGLGAGFFYINYPLETIVNNFILKPNDNVITSFGKEIYIDKCASCHGENLEGQTNWRERNDAGYLPAPPHDKTGHTWHHPDAYLFQITKYGLEDFIGKKYPNNMPAYKKILSDDEIIASLSYIKSMWPKSIQNKHDQINSRSNKKLNN